MLKLLNMRLLLIVLISFSFISCSKSSDPAPSINTVDSFTVSVNNGYGAAKYKIGDTVHIFSTAYSDNQLFDKWTGDISLLNASNEWHTWFIMSNQNVSVTGTIKSIEVIASKVKLIVGTPVTLTTWSYVMMKSKSWPAG